MDIKMIYLAERNPRFDRPEWVERWHQHGGFCRTLPIWDHIRHYEQCVALNEQPLVQTSALGPQPGSGGWDGVGMIWFWSMEALQRAIEEPQRPRLDADELETFSGPVAPTALLAREVIFRDEGGVGAKVIAFVRRKPGLSRDAFSDHWENHHAPLFLGCAGVSPLLRKYVQNHTLDASAGPMDAFDGVVEMGFSCTADAVRALSSPEYASDVNPDHSHFLDPSEMVVLITDERLLYEDALGQERVLSLR